MLNLKHPTAAIPPAWGAARSEHVSAGGLPAPQRSSWRPEAQGSVIAFELDWWHGSHLLWRRWLWEGSLPNRHEQRRMCSCLRRLLHCTVVQIPKASDTMPSGLGRERSYLQCSKTCCNGEHPCRWLAETAWQQAPSSATAAGGSGAASQRSSRLFAAQGGFAHFCSS